MSPVNEKSRSREHRRPDAADVTLGLPENAAGRDESLRFVLLINKPS